MASTLNLNAIVDVTVSVTSTGATTATFNQGLIVGNSTVISTTTRLKEYTSLSAMLTDGFTTASPEYLAAEMYFNADSAPGTLWVGVQGTSETLLQAITACRSANNNWYACYACGAAKTDHEAIAAYIETVSPSSVYFYDTQDADALSGATGNVLSTLKSENYKRDFGHYSTTTYAGAADMGEAMGLVTGLANSAFTMKFKPLTGVTPENLTPSQVSTIEGNNGNVYVNYNSQYNILEQGVMANGYYFDQVVFRDMLANKIQIEVMNLLVSNNKIPLTDAGITTIMNTINAQCDAMKTIGYIAPSGTWSGASLLNLNYGDTLPNGYITQAPKVSTLTSSQRSARQAPPIYLSLIESGAVHSVTIAVYVQP